ncbi:MAG: hypothetical protein WDZ89_03530 [Gemmatimonadota bacterium]|jgi:hypothetical protein
MTLVTIKILGAVAALCFGLYLGMARDYTQPMEEIDELLGTENKRKSARKHFTFLNLLQKKAERGSKRRRHRAPRKPFKM